MNPTFELLRPGDSAALATLHRDCFDIAWDAAAFNGLLAGGCAGWKIMDAERLIAFLLLRKAADEGEIISLAVAADARRQGVARTLLSHCVAAATQIGLSTLFLEVRQDNAAALALYRSVGFAVIASRKDYYRLTDGTTRHAIVMRRAL